MYEAARSLRTAERYLIAPPIAATFGSATVSVCDISERGARFRHDRKLETGSKAVLKLVMDDQPSSVNIEAMVVWSQAESEGGAYLSGVRTYASPDTVRSVIRQLNEAHRTNRIEELRGTDRFTINPGVDATFGSSPIVLADLSARGARIECATSLPVGTIDKLAFRIPGAEFEVNVPGRSVWTSVRSVSASTTRYQCGLLIEERPEQLRLAIGILSELNRAILDTKSLRLKLKILRARARQLAPSYRNLSASGIPAEQYLLIQGVREELRLNPEEAFHWYRRARLTIQDPATRQIAPSISSHPDALAVWEYLDRSIDPSIVSRAFDLGEP